MENKTRDEKEKYLKYLKTKLVEYKRIHTKSDTWENYEQVVLTELIIMTIQKELKNAS